nr:hypothetical protein GCM10020093_112300 [Planobispora longispora]
MSGPTRPSPPAGPTTWRRKKLFQQSCASCHGLSAEGIEGRGPTLVGVGAAAVDFQVSSGRMPLATLTAQAPRKKPAPG